MACEHRRQLRRWIIALGALLLPSFAGGQTGAPDQVLDIFDESCAFSGCHAGTGAAGNLDLTEEAVPAALINVPSSGRPQRLLIKPGDAQNSYLVQKITGAAGIDGDRMPKDGSPLSAAQLKVITDWIDALPPETPRQQVQRTYKEPFPGWSIGNLPTTWTVPTGGFMYRISHKFNSPVDAGFAEAFGLDGGAKMLTQLNFALTDNLSLNVARQRTNQTFEFGLKYRFLREKSDGSVPLSAAIYAGTDWASEKGIEDEFAFFGQLALSRQIGDRLALLLVPGILINGNFQRSDEDALVTLGIGGKFNFNRNYAVFAEVVPILAGEETAAPLVVVPSNPGKFYDTFVAGFEIHTGGHVFHIFATNSAGNSSNQYMSGGEFDLGSGDLRLGFNIYRLLNFPF